MGGDASRENGRLGGRPKGLKLQKTIEKEMQRERLRQIVCEQLEPLARAQVKHALGVSYLVLRNPDGSYTRATNKKQLDAAIAKGSEAFEIYTQAPSTAAFADLMNRALDKPAESYRVTGSSDAPIEHVFRWLTPTPGMPSQDTRIRPELSAGTDPQPAASAQLPQPASASTRYGAMDVSTAIDVDAVSVREVSTPTEPTADTTLSPVDPGEPERK